MAAPPLKGPRWERFRRRILLRDSYTCQMPGCGVMLTEGRTKPNAAVVHHKRPRAEAPHLTYVMDNCVAVCKRCHDSLAQQEEKLGYSPEIGTDGWPTDSRHPANAMRDF